MLERVDPEDLDPGPGDRRATGLDQPAMQNSFGGEGQLDRGPLVLGRELGPGQPMAGRDGQDVPGEYGLARIG
jgi:hypothetical protein